MIVNNQSRSSNFVNSIFEQNEKFAIIGLTGRVRAGQDDVVEMLTNPRFDHLRLTAALGGKYNNDAERENNIILRFLLKHWRPFVRIHVSSVMMSFLLETSDDSSDQDFLKRFKQVCSEVLTETRSDIKPGQINLDDTIIVFCRNLYHMIKNRIDYTNEEEKAFFKILNDSFAELKNILVKDKDVTTNMLEFWQYSFTGKDPAPHALENPKLLLYCFVILPCIQSRFKAALDSDSYIVKMQQLGNNLRAYGTPFPPHPDDVGKDIDGKNIFSIAERVNSLVKILRNTKIGFDNEGYGKNKTLVLIDDFKNVHEVFFFSKRYSSFYLMSVSTDEESRRNNFDHDEKFFQISGLNETPNIGRKKHNTFINTWLDSQNITDHSIDKLMEISLPNEISRKFRNKCNRAGLTDYEIEFCRQAFNDKLRRYCYLHRLHSFILQDVVPCIENADIFITNNYHKEYVSKQFPKDVGGFQLGFDVMRYVTLILHPALLTPTPIERCMQLAMAAKLNSGCLARQVGAVVTDKDFNILSLGWNDSPCGTISCIRRNFFDLKQKFDPDAYSEYELNNREFRAYIDKWQDFDKKNLNGLPGSFCFKDVYGKISGGREQIHTRALHGEERALAACGTKAKGGYLFTTSSPCELCAKRAKDAGIAKIYFIEQFSGISQGHVIQAGQPRAEYEFFTGSTGTAYTKLYTQIMPYKDELAALGFSPAENTNNSKQE